MKKLLVTHNIIHENIRNLGINVLLYFYNAKRQRHNNTTHLDVSNIMHKYMIIECTVRFDIGKKNTCIKSIPVLIIAYPFQKLYKIVAIII